MVLSIAALASFRDLRLGIPFGLPFFTDWSQGMTTGKRMANELDSSPCARCGSLLSSELQMLQHLAREWVRAAAEPQHCNAGIASSGQKVYKSDILLIALFLPFF